MVSFVLKTILHVQLQYYLKVKQDLELFSGAVFKLVWVFIHSKFMGCVLSHQYIKRNTSELYGNGLPPLRQS